MHSRCIQVPEIWPLLPIYGQLGVSIQVWARGTPCATWQTPNPKNHLFSVEDNQGDSLWHHTNPTGYRTGAEVQPVDQLPLQVVAFPAAACFPNRRPPYGAASR